MFQTLATYTRFGLRRCEKQEICRISLLELCPEMGCSYKFDHLHTSIGAVHKRGLHKMDACRLQGRGPAASFQKLKFGLPFRGTAMPLAYTGLSGHREKALFP